MESLVPPADPTDTLLARTLWPGYAVPDDAARWLHGLVELGEQTSGCISLADLTLSGAPLVYVNGEDCATSGYSPHEVLGHNCRFMQGPFTEPAAVDAILHSLREGVDRHVKLTNYRRDGTTFQNLLSLVPVFDTHGVYRFVVGLQFEVVPGAQQMRKLLWVQRLLDQLPHDAGPLPEAGAAAAREAAAAARRDEGGRGGGRRDDAAAPRGGARRQARRHEGGEDGRALRLRVPADAGLDRLDARRRVGARRRRAHALVRAVDGARARRRRAARASTSSTRSLWMQTPTDVVLRPHPTAARPRRARRRFLEAIGWPEGGETGSRPAAVGAAAPWIAAVGRDAQAGGRFDARERAIAGALHELQRELDASDFATRKAAAARFDGADDGGGAGGGVAQPAACLHSLGADATRCRASSPPTSTRGSCAACGRPPSLVRPLLPQGGAVGRDAAGGDGAAAAGARARRRDKSVPGLPPRVRERGVGAARRGTRATRSSGGTRASCRASRPRRRRWRRSCRATRVPLLRGVRLQLPEGRRPLPQRRHLSLHPVRDSSGGEYRFVIGLASDADGDALGRTRHDLIRPLLRGRVATGVAAAGAARGERGEHLRLQQPSPRRRAEDGAELHLPRGSGRRAVVDAARRRTCRRSCSPSSRAIATARACAPPRGDGAGYVAPGRDAEQARARTRNLRFRRTTSPSAATTARTTTPRSPRRCRPRRPPCSPTVDRAGRSRRRPFLRRASTCRARPGGPRARRRRCRPASSTPTCARGVRAPPDVAVWLSAFVAVASTCSGDAHRLRERCREMPHNPLIYVCDESAP